jgi:hypothetical protein
MIEVRVATAFDISELFDCRRLASGLASSTDPA